MTLNNTNSQTPRVDAAYIDTLADALKSCLEESELRIGEPLSGHTTFKIGGPAQVMVIAASEADIVATMKVGAQANAPVHVIGLGSNILVSDTGMPGIVLKISERFSSVHVEGTRIACQAGATNEQVARAAQAAGLAGYEFASGIPGTIGGAAIMNAGAYGGEFKDVAVRVRCVTPEGEIVEVSAADAAWGYRTSMMMQQGWVVVGATLELTSDDPQAIQERIDDLTQRRAAKQPLEMPSAGSTFKRPEGYFAGKLIQDAGLMGYTVGGAQVSTKHAGFVVNAGNATAADVRQLIHDVQQRVYDMAGVTLEPEVRMWGFE